MSAMGILRRNAFNVERQSAGLVFAGLKLLTKGLQLTLKARSYITADTPVHFMFKNSGPCRAHRLKIHIKCSEFGWVKNVTEEEFRSIGLGYTKHKHLPFRCNTSE